MRDLNDRTAELARRDGDSPEAFRLAAVAHARSFWVWAIAAALVWWFWGWAWALVPTAIAAFRAIASLSSTQIA